MAINSAADHLNFDDPFTERTPRIVNARKLHRASVRRKQQQFLAEGENSVTAAVEAGCVSDLYVTEVAAQNFGALIERADRAGVYIHPITDRAASALSESVTTTGVFALCRSVLTSVDEALSHNPKLVSIPVEASDPGNAGALIRIADAVGAGSVIFAGETVDPQGGKAVRSSAGSLFHLPVAREPNIEEVLDQARKQGLAILATAADGEVSLDEADEILQQPSAWLFGNEAHGLSPEVLAQADVRIRIPIRGRAESLNLATAAAICLYESAKAQAKVSDADSTS